MAQKIEYSPDSSVIAKEKDAPERENVAEVPAPEKHNLVPKEAKPAEPLKFRR